MSGDLTAAGEALQVALLGRGLDHLEVIADGGQLRAQARDPNWRSYHVIGMDGHPEVLARLASLDHDRNPVLYLTDERWVLREVGDPTELAAFAHGETDRAIAELTARIDQHLRHPVLALRTIEVADGFEFETLTLDAPPQD